MTPVLVLLGVAAGSWALRIGFVTVVDVDRLPAPIREALDHVGPAVMAALLVTTVAHGEGHAGLRLSVPEASGLLAAALVAARTHGLIWPLAAGMATFAAVGMLVGL